MNIIGLKTKPLISLPLDIAEVRVSSANLNEEGDYIISVESMKAYIICQHCERKLTKFHGQGRQLELRHLSILGTRTYIHYRPKQAKCAPCDDKLTTQKLDWYETKSPHTKAYDRHLMLQLIGSTVEDVSRKEKVGYDAVEGSLKRWIDTSVNWDTFTELKVIGIDEIALTKGRQNFIAPSTASYPTSSLRLTSSTVLPISCNIRWRS